MADRKELVGSLLRSFSQTCGKPCVGLAAEKSIQGLAWEKSSSQMCGAPSKGPAAKEGLPAEASRPTTRSTGISAELSRPGTGSTGISAELGRPALRAGLSAAPGRLASKEVGASKPLLSASTPSLPRDPIVASAARLAPSADPILASAQAAARRSGADRCGPGSLPRAGSLLMGPATPTPGRLAPPERVGSCPSLRPPHAEGALAVKPVNLCRLAPAVKELMVKEMIQQLRAIDERKAGASAPATGRQM